MKRAKREEASNTMDRISELPKEMLQRILYFLSQEDAVRTSVLSKSWRYVWCTRPNLDFSDDTFKGNKQEFISVVNNSLQRYYDQRLCLEEFHLCLSIGDHDDYVSLLEEWIPMFTTMGVKEIHLSALSNNDDNYNNRNVHVDLPSVVFRAESLKLLSLRNCKFLRKIPENILFERLQVLRLQDVWFKKEIFDKIIASCRWLTTMFFVECKGLKTIKLEKKLHKHLKDFIFINFWANIRKECSVEIDCQTLEKIVIIGCKVRFHGHKFSNLKSLTLRSVDISSNSTEQSQICINAPNIEYFDYSASSGPPISSISFTPLRMSKLRLHIPGGDDAQSWFLRLSELLQSLRRSKIYLSVDQFSRVQHIQEDTMNRGNKPVVVEHLELKNFHLSSCASVLNGLFYICRPLKITWWHWQGMCEKEREVTDHGEFFSKFQMMIDGNHDLEDLSIEIFDTSRKVWKPLPGTTLLECASLNTNILHFQLKWREACESEF